MAEAPRIMTKWHFKELAQLLQAEGSPDIDGPITSFVCHSAQAQPGALFFALEGQRCDGHQFLPQVHANGAQAAVVSRHYLANSYSCDLAPQLPMIGVDDPLRAMQQLARASLHRQKEAKVVAITGSVGKTTTKAFTHTLIGGAKRVFCSHGNCNSQIGLPLTLLNQLQGDEEVIILEMGMSAPKHIETLVQIAPPEIAVITAVELAHAQNFPHLEAIAAAKAEILQHQHTKLAILSADIKHFSWLVSQGSCQKLSYSAALPPTQPAMVRLFVQQSPPSLQLLWHDQPIALPSLPIFGAHNRHNFLAAACCAASLGISWDHIRQRIPLLTTTKQRLEIKEIDGVFFIDDSYNACEASVKAALAALPEVAQQLTPCRGRDRRVWALLGEMGELGPFAYQCHSAVADFALDFVDELFCFGPLTAIMYERWRKAQRPAHWSNDLLELIAVLQQKVAAADIVLIKGSRSQQLERAVALFSQQSLRS